MRKQDRVAPGALSAVQPVLDLPADAPEQERRRAFADWIASPDNPLTARVLVNRIWALDFGKPLVHTPSNFGATGELPTHPELLDDLAVRFIQSGWSLKWLQREIVLSRSYAQGISTTPLLHQTVGEALDLAAERWPEQEAVVVRDRNIRLTYLELHQQVETLPVTSTEITQSLNAQASPQRSLRRLPHIGQMARPQVA